MKTRRVIVFAAVLAGVAWVACATDFTGWSGAGNPDLASSATWNLESGLPTDTINIKASGYTFEASADATFSSIWFYKANITNTFQLAQGRTITLTGDLRGAMNKDCNNMQTTFSGGTWNVAGVFSPIYDYSRAPRNNTFILDDGCIVTNVGTFRVGYGVNAENSGNRVTIKGGSQLHVKTANVVYGWGRNNTFEVLDGLFTWNNSYLITTGGGRDNADGAYGNIFRVSGPNARVINLSDKYPYMGGNNDHDSQVIIENGGVWTNSNKAFYIGNGAARNQRLIVRSGGKLHQVDSVYLNFGVGACSNSVEVLDGGEVDAKTIYISSSSTSVSNIGGLVLVSNATLRCTRIFQGTGISPGQTVRIIGTNTVFETSYDTGTYPIFGAGGNSLFSLEDGAEWIYDLNDLSFGYTTAWSPSNRLQVVNGARLHAGKGMSIGYGSTKTDGHVLYVGNGAEFISGGFFRMYAHDNLVIVSNALLSVATGMTLGFGNPEEGGFSNLTVNVQGDVPRVRVAGEMTAKEGTRILFDVPEGGYATTNVPITCATWTDVGATKFEFTGLERLVESLKSKVVMPLVQVTNETFSANFKASVEAAKSQLPPKCSLSYSEDNDLLRLTVRPGVGFGVLVR